MKRILLILLLATPVTATATPVSFATFNIKFYGKSGGDSPDPTLQDRAIRSLMEDRGVRADVIAFQEIVDKDRLERYVLGYDYRCVSYDHRNEGHIHVVICHKRHLRLEQATDDSDYELEDVTLGSPRLRPGVHGVLTTASGRPLAHVVGLHLKASEEYTETRVRQMQVVADYLQYERHDILPVVVLGDVNTHTGDLTQLNNVFYESGLRMTHLYTNESYTWRVPTRGRKFDRVWVTSGTEVIEYPDVVGPCNVSTGRVEDIITYNELVSDHCPVKFTLDF